METWDLYDRQRRIIGEHCRGTELPPGGYHLVVHVWIRNSKGKYLMTQRSAEKATYPLAWECVGGSALKGESSIEAALRETSEEIGLHMSENDAEHLFTFIRDVIDGKRINDIVDVWLLRFDGDILLEQATTNEVEDAKWMDKEEIASLRDAGKLVSSIKDLRYFFEQMN